MADAAWSVQVLTSSLSGGWLLGRTERELE